MSLELTGRTRHRAQARRFCRTPLLVLQVEEAGDLPDHTPYDTHWYPVKSAWRDATIEDLTMLQARGVSV